MGKACENKISGFLEMSFTIWEMSFTIWEMSFTIFSEMSFGQIGQKKSLIFFYSSATYCTVLSMLVFIGH